MPHARSSCRGRTLNLLRCELEDLYAQRSAVDAAIRALQGIRSASLTLAEPAKPNRDSLDFRQKPCNLTNCRVA